MFLTLQPQNWLVVVVVFFYVDVCSKLAASARLASSVAGARSFASKIELPKLPYAYDALQPSISAQIMEIHHTKHHQTYVNNFNAAAEGHDAARAANDVSKLISLQSSLIFNGGGHVNHALFWENLAPKGKGGGGQAVGTLAQAIDKEFTSFAKFQEKFAASAAGVQGSGWAWLVYDSSSGHVRIVTRPNQDPVSTNANEIPLLGVDVWEHAYYLQYQNVRANYVKAIWDVLNWQTAEERFLAAKKK